MTFQKMHDSDENPFEWISKFEIFLICAGDSIYGTITIYPEIAYKSIYTEGCGENTKVKTCVQI